MNINSLDDIKSLIKDETTKVPVGKNTYFIRVAGPLNFNLVAIMGDTDIPRDERAIRAICACLCDEHGKTYLDYDDDESKDFVKILNANTQAALIDAINTFFKKKGS